MSRPRFGVVLLPVLLLTLLQTGGATLADELADRFSGVTERLVEAINAQDQAAIRRDFADVMLKDMPLEKSKVFFSGLTSHFGRIESLGPPVLVAPNQVAFVADCEKGTLDLSVTLDQHGKIAGLVFFPSRQPFAEVARRFVRAINGQDHTAFRQDFSEVMLKDFPSEKSDPLCSNLARQFGKLEGIEPPQVIPPNRAVVIAHGARANMKISLALDEHKKIGELWFNSAPPTPEPTTTVFRLPFDGEWLVGWGGNNKGLNHHHDTPHQHYAFDFLMVDKAGRSHKGEGKENQDYYAFGRPVLAPADGVVTDVIRGIRDNPPWVMNPAHAGGNTVIIRHREREFSILAHLQQGSIRVQCGDKVKRGQVLALCGNSGNSSEPHLHFHVQTTPVIQDAIGLPCRFEKMTITQNGKDVVRPDNTPVKSDFVTAAASSEKKQASLKGKRELVGKPSDDTSDPDAAGLGDGK